MPDTQPQLPQSPLGGVLHEIRWAEICPWLILVKSLRVALLVRVLLLAAIGVILTNAGWSLIHLQLSPELPPPLPLRETFSSLNPTSDVGQTLDETPVGQWTSGTLVEGWHWLTAPFLEPGRRGLSWQDSLAAILRGLWAIAVWSLFGGAICRIAAIYLTRNETIGPVAALREALITLPSTLAAPLFPLLAAGALAVPLVLLGFLLRFDALALVVGLVWVLVLVWGFFLVLVLIAPLFGWPLMYSCVSVERSDAFDGVSRCYAYVYQRPLHFAFFVFVAAVLCMLGNLIVGLFAEGIVDASEWTASWGMGESRALSLLTSDSEASPAPLATKAINQWKWALSTVASSFPIASLWPMSVGIYLLLRRQVDATELEEITLADGSLTGGLPSTQNAAKSDEPAVSGE